MKLFIMRHGAAVPHAATDEQRELTDRGRQEVQKVVEKSLSELTAVNEVWISPYRRARQTAEILLHHLPNTPAKVHPGITPDGHMTAVIDEIAASGLDSLVLVSHMPLVGELVNSLCGKPRGFYSMGTAALACIDLDVVAVGCGELIWLR